MKKQFTLIELITVIAILGILSAIVIPNISDLKGKSISASVNSSTRSFQTAVDLYALEHEGDYPTLLEPTIETPQFIDLDKLYPKYIKNKPDEKKIASQHYWVDYMGKVWGSTVDAPNDIFKSPTNLEWNQEKEVSSYQIYELSNRSTGSMKNTQTFSLKQVIDLKEKGDKIKLDIENGKNYLISSTDRYGLETAPVGISYEGLLTGGKKPMNPILMQEGEFSYELTSEEMLYWDDFKAVEEKPEGTEIHYSFSTDNGATYIEDFYALEPAKNLKIKITIKSFNGKYPSLYDLRIYYHYADEEKVIKKPQRVLDTPTKVIDEIQLGENEYLNQITLTDHHPLQSSPSVSYQYAPSGTTNFVPITSLSDVPAGSIVQIIRETTTGASSPTEFKSPIVEVNTQRPTVSHYDVLTGPKTVHTDPELEDTSWTTFQTLSFFATAGDGQRTHWIRADIVDNKPENTRILYRYSYSDGIGWSSPVENIGEVADSRMLKVMAYLQVKKEFSDQSEKPSITSIKLVHSKGAIDLDMVKPSGAIYLEKSNNQNNDIVSTESKINWNYEAFDPQDKKIVEAVWGGDKRDQYTTPGTYTVTLKLRNELNYWSNTITYTFEVKPEIPIAVLKPERSLFSSRFPIKWDTTSSYDPDNDGIAKVEWGGDYRQNNIYAPGSHTIKMRVQDKEGNWSAWIAKTFTTVDSIFYNIDGKGLDGDLNTYYTLDYTGTSTILWDADLTNKAVAITYSYINGGYDKQIQILDEQDKPLSFINPATNQFGTSMVFPATNSVSTIKMIIPPNAAKIVISGWFNFNFYEIKEAGSFVLPQTLTAPTYTTDRSSITLNWNIPSDSVNVHIYRNGTYVGSSKTGTFKDTSLYSDTSYQYTLYSENEFGNRSLPTELTAKTIRPAIIWHDALSPKSIDGDLSTYYTLDYTGVGNFTWEGDLTNRVVTLNYSYISGGYDKVISILDNTGKALSFINADTNQMGTALVAPPSNTVAKVRFIIPTNAAKITLTGWFNFNVYEIEESKDLTLAPQITNLSYTSEKSKITLNWTKSTEVKTVHIYRDGVYVGSSTTNSYTDSSLLADTAYKYEVYSENQIGNRNTSVKLEAKTIRPDILWHSTLGPKPVDGDITTGAYMGYTGSDTLTWEGDLTGKTVALTYSYLNGGYDKVVQIYDKNNNILSFTNADTSQTVNAISLPASNAVRTSKFVIPANAAKITLTGWYDFNLYEIEDLK